jgi:hypothetical protein
LFHFQIVPVDQPLSGDGYVLAVCYVISLYCDISEIEMGMVTRLLTFLTDQVTIWMSHVSLFTNQIGHFK